MENIAKRIYLVGPMPSNDDLYRKFLSDFQIPKDLGWRLFSEEVNKTQISGTLKYLCTNCEAELLAEWNYINRESFPDRIEKVHTTELGSHEKIVRYRFHNVGSHGYFSKQTTLLKNFTETEYQEYLEILQRINESFPSCNQKLLQQVREAGEMTHCPVCGCKLLKKYPFTDMKAYNGSYISGDLPENLLDSFSWKSECYQDHPWLLWRDNQKLQQEYENRGKRWPEFEQEWLDKKFYDMFEAPVHSIHAQFLQSCDIPAPIKRIPTGTGDWLRDYLLNLINLETNIVCMSKRLNHLYLLRAKNNRDLAFQQNSLLYRAKRKLEDDMKALKEEKQRLEYMQKAPLEYETVEPPRLPQKPEPVKAGLFNKKKAEVLNAQAQEDYQRAMEEYNHGVRYAQMQTEKNRAAATQQRKESLIRDYEQLQKRANQWKTDQKHLQAHQENAASIPTKAVGTRALIHEEIRCLEESLQKTFQCRNQLYAYNIVFDKYRNLVAISSFYEYLMSGRCETLEGINGAYNIYESESRMDSILTGLDEIKTKLDEIKENQFMIYNKLKAVESSLNTLNSSMERAISSLESLETQATTMNEHLQSISSNVEVIAHNSAVTAYYSKVNAELTNAIGFMMAFNG